MTESCLSSVNFNSRLRKETNPFFNLPFYFWYISIHVSARRRTIALATNNACCLFQFTSPCGDEPDAMPERVENELNFNSRLRKETNDADYAERGTLCDFNSRLRKETNTIDLSLEDFSSRISIHISARRRT